MTNRLLALLVLAVMCAGCTVDASEGLMEATFSREKPLSEIIIVEVEEDLTEIQFIIETKLKAGSATVYVYDPDGQVHTLALGITNSSQMLEFDHPSPGQWKLEIHIDGNSETVVDGRIRLALNRK